MAVDHSNCEDVHLAHLDEMLLLALNLFAFDELHRSFAPSELSRHLGSIATAQHRPTQDTLITDQEFHANLLHHSNRSQRQKATCTSIDVACHERGIEHARIPDSQDSRPN